MGNKWGQKQNVNANDDADDCTTQHINDCVTLHNASSSGVEEVGLAGASIDRSDPLSNLLLLQPHILQLLRLLLLLSQQWWWWWCGGVSWCFVSRRDVVVMSSCGRGVVVALSWCCVVWLLWVFGGLYTRSADKRPKERETKSHNISYNMCLAMDLHTCQDSLNVFQRRS